MPQDAPDPDRNLQFLADSTGCATVMVAIIVLCLAALLLSPFL